MNKKPSFNRINFPKKKSGLSTRAIRTRLEKTFFNEHSSPIYPTSSYWFDSADAMAECFADETYDHAYSRYSNPNTDEFAAKLASLEQVECGIATASGMAAVFCSLMSRLNQGDHIIAANSLFGSTYNLLSNYLPKWGIDATFAKELNPEDWQQHVRDNTRLVFCETPTNPGLEIIDLKAVKDFCQQNKLLMLIDNCFATPCLQQPVHYGADIIIHSATKFIDGQGRVLGGAVLGGQQLIQSDYAFLRQTGATLSPFNAWLLARSIDTLPLRMKAHSENALQLATWLEKRSDLVRVLYPGLSSHPQHHLAMQQMSSGGGIVCFELAGGIKAGECFLDSLEMLTLSANLGDTRTIVTHPSSTTHARLSADQRASMNITDGLIRISVGLEDIEDIKETLDQAFAKVLSS